MLESLEGKRGDGPRQAAAARDRGPVRPADGGQQRADARHACRRSSPTAPQAYAGARRRPLARHPGVPARRQRRAAAASSRRPFGVTLRRARRRLRRRHAVRPPGARRPGRRPARRVPARRPASTCRWTTRRSPRPARMVGHGGIVVFDDTVDMAAQARFAMEFCAEESCGKCTPCRVGAVRGVEVIDRIVAGERPRREPRAARRPLRGDDRRVAVRDGRADADARAQRARSTSPRTSTGAGPMTDAEARHDAAHASTTSAPRRPTRRARRSTVDGRRHARSRVPAGTSVMRAAALAGIDIPKLCATDRSRRSAPAGSAWSRSTAARARPPRARRRCADGHGGRARRRPRLREAAPRRHGAVHLRPPARLPDLPGQRRLRAAGHGRRRRAARGPLRLRRRRTTSTPPTDDSNPYFTFDPRKCIVCSRCVRACDEIQGTFALTIAGPRLRLEGRRRARTSRSWTPSACRAAPACRPARPPTLQEKTVIELGIPTRTVLTTCAYCGVGCSFKAELRGDEVVRMVPVQGRRRQRGPLLRQGPLRLGLRHAPGPDARAR